jgi:hypothetical protein
VRPGGATREKGGILDGKDESGEPCKGNIQNGSQKKIEVVQEDVAVLVGCTLIYVS